MPNLWVCVWGGILCVCACTCSFYTNKTDTLVQKYSSLLSVYYFGKPQLWQDSLLSLGGSHPKVHGSCSISSLTLKPLPQNCPCSVELILLTLFQRSSAVCFSLLICSLFVFSLWHPYCQTQKHTPTSNMSAKYTQGKNPSHKHSDTFQLG